MRYTPILALAAALGTAAPAFAEPFTAAERGVLHEEIRSYLLENPEILTEMIALLEERQAVVQREDEAALVAANADALFDDGFSFVGGNPEGSLTVVEFLDYQCSFCRRAHPELKDLLATDGDIRWIVKEIPILGPGSELAARAAIATMIAEGPDAYARLNDRLMRLEGPIDDGVLDRTLAEAGLDPAAIRAGMDAPEVDRRLEATGRLSQALGIQGTPTFVFGRQMVRGYLPLDAMQSLVAELRDAG